MIPSLVPRRDLPNAIALNSTQFNLSRVLGPVAGGAVLAAVGVAGVLPQRPLLLHRRRRARQHDAAAARARMRIRARSSEELRSGLHYVRDTRADAGR